MATYNLTDGGGGGSTTSTEDSDDTDDDLSSFDQDLQEAADELEQEDETQTTSTSGSTGSFPTSGSGSGGTTFSHEETTESESSGIDTGEPISGVDGDGSPRDDRDATPLEGGSGSVDGLDDGSEQTGGSTGAIPTSGDPTEDTTDEIQGTDTATETEEDSFVSSRGGSTGAMPTSGGGTGGTTIPDDTESDLTEQEKEDQITRTLVEDDVLDAPQGAEARDDVIGEQAREFEQEVVEESPFFENTDQVQIAFDEEEMQFVPEPTAVGRAALRSGDVGSATEFFSEQVGDVVPEHEIEGIEVDDGQFSPVFSDRARENIARENFLSGGVHHGDDIPVHVEDAEEFQRDVLRGKFDDEDFEFTATDEGVEVNISQFAIRDRLQDDEPGDQTGPQPQEEPTAPLPDRIGSLIEDAQDEGLESVERGGALSEAGRDAAATTLGVGFQNPEELSEYVGISEERLAEQNVDISGPAVTELDTERDGLTIFELEHGEPGEVDESVLSDLTAGQGILSESQREAIEEDIEQRRDLLDFGDELGSFAGDVTGDERVEGVATGVGRVPADAATATAHLTLGVDTASQVAPNVGSAVEEHGVGDVALTSLEVGGRGVEIVTRGAQERPHEFAGSLAGAVVGGAVVGKAAGSTARFTRDRVRTAGAETFELRSGAVVNPETGRFFSPRSNFDDADARFPGAADPNLYRSQPAEAVRRQADEFTPSSVDRRFQEAGVTEGTTLKKGLELEPDGPGPGGRGFATQEGGYESPGAFAGPELSPYFLQIGSRGSGFSLRPGLPDFGDSATGVLVRTRVDTPDARSLPGFQSEMLARQGETTAFTKPRRNVEPSEIEAIIPPEAEFADLGGGVVRNTARRLGVGSDFAVRIGGRSVPFTDRSIGGRRIPLRPVTDPELVDGGGRRNFGAFLSDERGQVGAGATSQPRTRQLSEIRSPIREPVDRPFPIVPGAPGSGRMTEEGQPSASSEASFTETVDSPTVSTGFERRPSSPSASEVPYASSSAVASSASSAFSEITSGFASSGSRGASGATSQPSPSAASPSSTGPPSSPGFSFGASSSIPGISSPPGSPSGPPTTTTPPTTGTPPAQGFGLAIGRSKKDDDAEFIAGEQQFIVPFAEPEDVVGADRTFDLGF